MCRGDPSVETFEWWNGKPTTYLKSQHKCVNWNRLSSWAANRSVNVLKPDILKNEKQL